MSIAAAALPGGDVVPLVRIRGSERRTGDRESVPGPRSDQPGQGAVWDPCERPYVERSPSTPATFYPTPAEARN